MNIPDEVIEQAVAAHKAPRLHVNDTVHDRMIDMRAAAEVVTEWARKEALREAADMADRMYAGTDGTTAEREWIGGVRATARNIRALAEGDN